MLNWRRRLLSWREAAGGPAGTAASPPPSAACASSLKSSLVLGPGLNGSGLGNPARGQLGRRTARREADGKEAARSGARAGLEAD